MIAVEMKARDVSLESPICVLVVDLWLQLAMNCGCSDLWIMVVGD